MLLNFRILLSTSFSSISNSLFLIICSPRCACRAATDFRRVAAGSSWSALLLGCWTDVGVTSSSYWHFFNLFIVIINHHLQLHATKWCYVKYSYYHDSGRYYYKSSNDNTANYNAASNDDRYDDYRRSNDNSWTDDTIKSVTEGTLLTEWS